MAHFGNADICQIVVVSLALLSATPPAASCTAYTLNGDGDISLSVGLLLLITLLCPVLFPVSLNIVDYSAYGDFHAVMHKIKDGASSFVIIFTVVVPTVAGLLLRPLIGGNRVDAAKPLRKTVNYCDLLLINYIFASTSMPKIIASPDWSFLGWVILFMTILCVVELSGGWWIARLLGATRPKAVAVMFGVGLDSYASSFVIALPIFGSLPKYLIPVVFYGLLQQLVAAVALAILGKKPPEKEISASAARA
jgi:predicted Na+-dependent transporter